MTDEQVVWLTEYRTYGFLIQEAAHYAVVKYYDKNNSEWVFELIENDEYKGWEEQAIEYDSEG